MSLSVDSIGRSMKGGNYLHVVGSRAIVARIQAGCQCVKQRHNNHLLSYNPLFVSKVTLTN